MVKFLSRILAFALMGASFLLATSAEASTATTTMSVGATITSSCSVSATSLAFGSIDPLTNATTNTDQTTTLSVTCSNGTAYNVGLDAGTSTGATVTARKMVNGANTLAYDLFSDSARTQNWGVTIGTDTVAGTGTGAAQTLTVYGRVPSGQNTTIPGTYADTINVTVTY